MIVLRSLIKLATISVFMLAPEILHGQNTQERDESRWEISGDIFTGVTSIFTGFVTQNKSNIYQYRYIPTFGFGGDFGYTLSPHISTHFSIGYLQRGAEFTMPNTEKRTFQLYYLDAWGYFEYLTLDKLKFTFLSGLTQSTLITARLTALGGNSSVMDDFKRIDFGFIAGPGILLPVHKHKIRIRTLFSYGFRDVFAETHFNDGIKAHNHAYLFQVGYIW